ncbi:MAG: T9SS type A sorting domain-containing protein [Chitinophagaceae bacterium]
MKNCIAFLLIVCCIHNRTTGQAVTPQVINSTGGSFVNNNYIIEWNVGEMALVTAMQSSNANGNYVFSNGFLQPFALFPKQTEKMFGINDIRIFPNPAREKVEISFQVPTPGRIRLCLYDGMGQAVFVSEFLNTGLPHTEKINLSGMASGSYLLQATLSCGTEPVQLTRGTYKIIKIN